MVNYISIGCAYKADAKIGVQIFTFPSIPKEENIRWLILVDFLLIECMLSFDIRRVSVLSSSSLYLSTKNEIVLSFITSKNT